MTGLVDFTLVQFLVKVSLWLSGAWALQLILVHRNPRWRVGLWRTTAVGMMILALSLLTRPWYELQWLPRGIGTVASPSPQHSMNLSDAVADSVATLDPQRRGPGRLELANAPIAPVIASRLTVPNAPVPASTAHSPAESQKLIAGGSQVVQLDSRATHWRTVMISAYAIVAGWLILKVALSILISIRIIQRSKSAPGWLHAMAEELTRVHRIPVNRVRITTQFQSPVLCGLFRPVILLPESMLHGASAEREVKAALSHEAAHAAGYDLWWDVFIAVVAAIFWPNPLVWRIRTAHRAACEQVSDRVAADVLGDVTAYQSLLAGMALRVSGQGEVGLAMARRVEIRSRLESLLRIPRAPRLGRRGLLVGLCVLAGSSVIGVSSLVAQPDAAVAPAKASTEPPATAIAQEAKAVQAQKAQPAVSLPPVLKIKEQRRDDNQAVAGKGPAGMVLTPDGKPAAGASLTLVTEQDGMQFSNGYKPYGGKQTVAADERGRFEFDSVEDESLIVVVHDSGYAEVLSQDVIKSSEVRLQAWAKLDVVLKYKGQPLPGVDFAVSPEEQRGRPGRIFAFGIASQTDAAGRVSFDKVVPRTVRVYRTIGRKFRGHGVTYYFQHRKIDLRPGKTVQLELGGSGATIKGTLSMDGEPPARHEWSLNEPVSIAATGDDVDPDERQHYRAFIDDDGSFHVDDIPPGSYTLSVNLTAAPTLNGGGDGVRLARIDKNFEVPPKESDVDLGVIKGSWDKKLGAGEQAPLFVAEGIGGDAVRLGALRGKLLLLDFWASSSAPCMAEMPELGELHQEFAKDSRFQVVGLSLDRSLEIAKTAIDSHGLSWPIAFAGPGTHSFIPSRYDVTTLPERLLIDVDGKILWRGNDLKVVAAKVRDRLKRLPAVGTETTGGVPVKIDDRFRADQPAAVILAIDNIDYKLGMQPKLMGPGLKMWSADGKETRTVMEMGTSGWCTGPQRLALDPERERIYACDTHNKRLVAFDRHGGQLFATSIPDLHGAAVDEKTGDVWCLAVSLLNSGELLILDPTGREKNRLPIAAFGLAYSPVDDAFWIVGKSIAKVNREGRVLSQHPLTAEGFTFTEVVIDRQRGGAWVLEIDHPDRPRSTNSLWKVQSDGTATVTHLFPKVAMPRTLACINGQPWLAVMKNYRYDVPLNQQNLTWELQRFDRKGELSNTLPLPALDIAVGVKTGNIWLKTKDSIIRIDENGAPQLTIPCKLDVEGVQLLAF